MKITVTENGETRLHPSRVEHWRRELAESVAAAAKHGAPEHIDHVIQSLFKEVYSRGFSDGIHA